MPRLRLPNLLRLPTLALALALASCSKTTTAPSGSTAEARGTPLTGENAFETGTLLVWSQATNEVVGDAKGGGTLGGPGLAAVRTVDGASRLLVTNPSLFPTLTPDGQQVYYDEITSDSTLLRRRSLGSTSVARITGAAGLNVFSLALSADGRYVAYAGPGADPLERDSIRVLDTVSGQRVTLDPGTPVAFSPDDGTLLVVAARAGYATVALSNGAATPVDFGLPAGATVGAVRWDAGGLRVAYTINASELHVMTGGGDLLAATLPEAIVPSSPIWSPDGTHLALWTMGPIDGGADTAYRLYVVSPGAHSAGLVALGRSIGGAIAWSSDGTRLAYLFAGRLFAGSAIAAGITTGTR
ncbi:MAG: hypothetical protein ACHQ52_03395 [Candidatus Eisenbacteria bacterium]